MDDLPISPRTVADNLHRLQQLESHDGDLVAINNLLITIQTLDRDQALVAIQDLQSRIARYEAKLQSAKPNPAAS